MKNNNGLQVFFLHGWGMNQGIWKPFLEYCRANMTKEVTIHALDLPGCGNNIDSTVDSGDLDNIVQSLARNLPSNTILVGWSMGGLIAQKIADLGNENLIAQIQIASTPKFLQSDNWVGIKPEVLEMFGQQLQSDHLTLLKRFLGIQCMGLEKPKVMIKTMLEAICEFPMSSRENLAKSLHILKDTDLRPHEHESKAKALPCLRIYGALDGLVPKRVIPQIETLYPASEICILPKASHAPFLSHPEETWQAISRFIKSLPGQSGF